MIKGFVYKNIFNQVEVNTILDHFATQPIATQFGKNTNKNLDYHIESSLAYKLIRPKINSILGDHNFQNGSYKECVEPYPTHIDNIAFWNGNTYTFDVTLQHECFLLIPLVTDTRFRTVLFDILSDERYELGELMPQTWTNSCNNLDVQDFMHCKSQVREQIQYLPLDIDVAWNAGDVIRWHRNQLHCSSNFARYNLIKKFVLLGIG